MNPGPDYYRYLEETSRQWEMPETRYVVRLPGIIIPLPPGEEGDRLAASTLKTDIVLSSVFIAVMLGVVLFCVASAARLAGA